MLETKKKSRASGVVGVVRLIILINFAMIVTAKGVFAQGVPANRIVLPKAAE